MVVKFFRLRHLGGNPEVKLASKVNGVRSNEYDHVNSSHYIATTMSAFADNIGRTQRLGFSVPHTSLQMVNSLL